MVQARVTLLGRHQSFKVQLDQLRQDFPLTQSVILAKPRLNHAKEWMDEHNAELDSYSEAQGHSYQQNKGKADIREVIKWSEEAYGAYQW